jgi:hypothetical protein
MRSWVLVVSVLVGPVMGTAAHAQSAVIQQVVDSVNIDSMLWHDRRLSGEMPVNVGNGEETILSRHQSNAGNALASMWLQQQFIALGYTPEVQVFGTTGANIIAERSGVIHPERKVVICAHYDDMPGGPVNAPGADDNGSGVCAVLEAARTMAGHTFGNTIVFALWDEEEQGSIGSAYYASVAGGNDDQLTAVVNMDAIGYDGNGDGLLRIYTGPVANSEAIKDSALMVNDTYGLGLPIAINDPGSTFSDHASFWAEGYGAIMIGEDYTNDLDPHYHTPTDSLQYMDLGYWHGLARLAIGTAAVMAVPLGTTLVPSTEWTAGPELELFPNPVRKVLHLRLNLENPARATLILTDATGRNLGRDIAGISGSDAVELDVGDLAPGAYIARLRCGNTTVARRFLKLP